MRFFRLQSIAVLAVLVGLAGLALGLSPRAEAQSYAALHGTVTDSSGAVISNAGVTALNTNTGIETTVRSGKNGYYIFPQLQVGGPYTVTVTASGFESFVSNGLMLNVNDNREVNGKLAVGGALETVQVSAVAVQVETSNTQLQQIATAQQLEEIPLEGRDPAGLQKLEPGVVESNDRFGTFSSNGNETAQNSYLLNGIDLNDASLESEGIQINPDALQEENIVTSTMNPEFARNSGAVVNQVLKSGTNDLHGSGFEFYRDTFMNNGNYFSQTRPVFHQNLYGGTLGGPVVKDKLFFFLAYQGLRNRTAQTTLQTTLSGTNGATPTGQFGGNFTADTNYATGAPNSAGLSSNPIPFNIGSCVAPMTWATCFSSGTVNIPTSEWNPVALALTKKYIPQSNETLGGTPYYNFNALNTEGMDQGIIRIDYTLSSKDTLWASSVFQSSPETYTLAFGGSDSIQGGFPGFGMAEGNHYKLFSASWTHTFSANLLNELRASYYRNPFAAINPAKVVTPASAGFAITPQDPESGIPFIQVGSYFNLGFSYEGPQPRNDDNLTYADNFTWVRGNHSLKFGALFEQFRSKNPFDVYNNGDYGFFGGAEGGGTYSSGDPLIDFALGVPDTYNQTNNGFIDAVATELYGYAQDNWKVSSDFTFNYGISWDVEKPNINQQDGGLGIICYQNTSATSTVFPGAPPGLFYPGDAGCNNAGSPTPHYDHFGPRIGFAWSPSSGPSALIGEPGSHSFSVRAGFGVYYNRDQEEQSLQNLEDPPFVYVSRGAADVGGSPGFANPFTDVTGDAAVSKTNPFPFSTPKAGATNINWPGLYATNELAAFEPYYNVPYTYNFNLNIQRALGGHMIAQVGYVGSLSRRLATWFEGDPITPAGHAACLANPACGNPNSISSIHELFPQYTADPVLVPGNPDGLPNGTPWYFSVGEQDTEGESNYNALQASLIKAVSHGLQFTVAYTYSHALDDGSGYESVTGGPNQLRERNYVPGFGYLNYGSSDFDARHRLSTSYVYTLPVFGFMKSNAIFREGLGGWGLGGVTALQTGYPIGFHQSTESSGWCDGFSYFGCFDVPEISTNNLAHLNIRAPGNQLVPTAPFSAEPLGTFGNTGRNFYHGPGFDYTNLQLSKYVHFSSDGRRYVQLRIEAFNLFNHANFANPTGNFNSRAFGTVTSVDYSSDPNGDPSPGRAVQLAGKVFF